MKDLEKLWARSDSGLKSRLSELGTRQVAKREWTWRAPKEKPVVRPAVSAADLIPGLRR